MSHQNSEGAVDAIAGRLETAFNSGDARALAALYMNDAVLMPPNQSAVSGKLEIESWFERALQRRRTVRILPVESKIMGDHAFQVGTFTSSPSAIDGSSSGDDSGAVIAAKYVLVLKSIAGEWKIQHDIWNLDQ